ncbi:MAG TPA: orotate phosphoribosyltransferase [Armatimonadota bacterium]|nr:orotate phosphoribosyltransferase [Armatimonadota bacterium]
MNVEDFALELHRIGGVKFGEFTLKSGRKSPIYVDLRGLVSHPKVLRMAGEALADVLRGLEFDRIAGLPYAGLPLAVSASLAADLPMLYARKEAKEYGTKRRIEGDYAPGQTVALLDDVITDGGAKLELAEPFREEGLAVRDFVVLVDREQGGRQALAQHGYRLHAVFTLREVLEALHRRGAIPEETYRAVSDYLAAA